MSNRTIAAAAGAALIMVGALSACNPAPGASGGASTPAAGASTPQAVIDARPLAPPAPSPHIAFSGTCKLDILPEGVGLVAGGGLVIVHAYSSCKAPLPWNVTITTGIQQCTAVVCAEGDWQSLPGSFQADGRLPLVEPLSNLVGWHTNCVAGVSYRLAARVTGHDAVYIDTKKTEGSPFIEPPLDSSGRPTYRYGTPVSFASCE